MAKATGNGIKATLLGVRRRGRECTVTCMLIVSHGHAEHLYMSHLARSSSTFRDTHYCALCARLRRGRPNAWPLSCTRSSNPRFPSIRAHQHRSRSSAASSYIPHRRILAPFSPLAPAQPTKKYTNKDANIRKEEGAGTRDNRDAAREASSCSSCYTRSWHWSFFTRRSR